MYNKGATKEEKSVERDKNKVGAPGGRNHQTREENDCFLQLINHRQSPAMRQTIANHYRSYAVIVETRLSSSIADGH